MDRTDRMIRSTGSQRILRCGGLLSVCALAGSLFLGSEMAQMAVRHELRTVLKYAGDLSGMGISSQTDPTLMPDYPALRTAFTAVLFLLSMLLLWGCILCALRQFSRTDRDLWRLWQDCLRLADDPESELTPCGSEASAMRRLCDGIRRLADRTAYLAEDARREQQQLRDLIVDVSHQMKTALAVMRLNRDMLDTLTLPEEERTRLSDEIVMQLDAMELLVLEALKLARLSAGAVQYDLAETDLAETCRLAAARVEPLCRQQQIEVDVCCEEEPVFPHDRTWLCEAICNLLKNAADHAGCTRLELALSPLPDAVKLTVTDNGKGIEPAQIFHIFERFHAQQQPSKMQNTGVGLAIAKQIFSAHGSTLCVFSDSRGTQFFSVLHTGAADAGGS